ncbi:MAG: ATP-dependent RNA helicase HrpA [Deltaproteobacteria bacterium]|nr:ATP-dependent RNA helicase HrpA [Deltaproteobacteria bacterium]
MIRDMHRTSLRLGSIRKKPHGHEEGIEALLKKIEKSVRERQERLNSKPPVTLARELPITSKAKEIIRLIKENPVVIVSGETGCGKSTQIPKMCLDAGRGIAGKIGCTQPRRIAAVTIAHRIAQELGEEIGGSVGFKIRFRDRTGPKAFIKIMTDGMLLAETQAEPMLYEYDTIIIDEAHERTLNIDFILGILKTLLPKRPELKVIIASATLDTDKFSTFFGGAPVVTVTGRSYPIDVEYHPIDPVLEEQGEITYVDMAIRAVDSLRLKGRVGDILIFMPTEEDILETCDRLKGRRYRNVEVLPLFARLPASDQARVYSLKNEKIIVATNVAETSLTIPGIRYVIDTGLARIPRYLPKTRTTSLAIGPISRSSADQRKGRCGRVQQGVCVRLYSEKDYESRPLFTPPEIRRSNLAEVILRMLFLRLGSLKLFPFLDPPGDRSIKDGFDVLLELGAVTRKGQDYELTSNGKLMAKMPLDPRISRMVIEAGREDCLEETSVIAAALSIRDPRERPADKALQADQMHGPFKDPDSDFLTMLKIWNRYNREWESLKTQNRMRKFCTEHFLSYSRMREWIHTHDQITAILREQRIALKKQEVGVLYDRIHRSVLSGFLSNIALRKEKNVYLAARGREVMLFPGSTLFKKAPPWIVAAEIVKTSRLFARTAARINPEWLESLGGTLLRSTYTDPHWDRHRGEVRAFEQVSLFGLPIVSKRLVPFKTIDPKESHRIFVQSALVEGDMENPPPFLVRNLEIASRISAMEDKLRRRDILIGDFEIADFYSKRLEGVSDVSALKKTIKDKGGDGFLNLKEEDLMFYRPDDAELAQYPDRFKVNDITCPCEYSFAPGKDQDGLTLKIPLTLISGITPERLSWGVPGLLKEKVTALIKGLPKTYRKQLVPVSRTVDEFLQGVAKKELSLISTLSAFLYKRYGVDIPASVWEGVDVPEHLKVRITVVDHTGKELESGKDIHLLRRLTAQKEAAESGTAWNAWKEKWEKKGLTTWESGEFGEIPLIINNGEHPVAYLALKESEEGVGLHLFRNREEALISHRKGVRRLLERHLAKDLKYLRRNLALPKEAAISAGYFGGAVALEEKIFERLLAQFFEKDLRSASEMKDYAESARAKIMEKGLSLKNQVQTIIETCGQLQRAMDAMESSTNPEAALCLDMRREFEALLPRNFLDLYDSERLSHLPRYLKAMNIRLQRGTNNVGKHRTKSKQIEEYAAWLQQQTENVSPHTSVAKREALNAFRWMIEELKVSVFAQELKTPFPVSAKRLEERKKEIERLI